MVNKDNGIIIDKSEEVQVLDDCIVMNNCSYPFVNNNVEAVEIKAPKVEIIPIAFKYENGKVVPNTDFSIETPEQKIQRLEATIEELKGIISQLQTG